MARLLTLLAASTMTVMAGATIAPALPAMAAFFHEVPDAEVWVKRALTIPALFTALGAPLAGLLADRVGRRPLLITAAVVYALAGSSGFFLDSLPWILIGRALLGLGVAGTMTASTTLIADYYEGAERRRVMGLQAAFNGFGGVIYLMAGGLLAEVSWRVPFLVYLVAVAFLPLMVMFLPEPETPTREQRAREEVEGERFPWMLTAMLYGVAFLFMVGFFTIPVQLPFFLERVAGVGSTQTGMAIAAFTFVAALSAMQYRRVRGRLSYPAVSAVAFALMCLGFLILSGSGSYGQALLGLVVLGGGMGQMSPNFMVWANEGLPPVYRGRAVGGLVTSFFLGQFASPLMSQPIAARWGLSGMFGVVALLAGILALAFTLFEFGRRRARAT